MLHTVLQLTSIVLSPTPCPQIPKSPIEQTGKWIAVLQCGKHYEVDLPSTSWELGRETTWSAEESSGKDSLRKEPDKKQVKGNLGREIVGKFTALRNIGNLLAEHKYQEEGEGSDIGEGRQKSGCRSQYTELSHNEGSDYIWFLPVS